MSAIEEQSKDPTPTAPERLWIGLDVGGTKIEGVAASDSGGVRGRVLLPTDTTTAEHAVESVASALQAVIHAAGAETRQVAAVGLGIPGKVVNGVVSLAVNLKLETYPLAGVLSQRFGLPVFLENDVRAAALGAYAWVRERRPVTSMVYLSLGTGISAGVILDGRLHRGFNGMAGEIGHAVLDPGGERCICGMQGCFETVAAGPAIARQGLAAARVAAANGTVTLLRQDGPLTAEDVFDAAREGDPVARRVVRRVAHFVARAVYNLVMHYDVEVVALGGGVSHAGAVFFGPVRDALAALSAASPLAREMLCAGLPERCEKVILVPQDADPAWRGMILLAKSMAGLDPLSAADCWGTSPVSFSDGE